MKQRKLGGNDDEEEEHNGGGGGSAGASPAGGSSTSSVSSEAVVSVCGALMENFVLDVLRVDQNCLSAEAQDALDYAMSREKRPKGHVLDAVVLEQRKASARRRKEEEALAAALSSPGLGLGSGSGADPVVSKMRPGQVLKCPVAMGRLDNHICDVLVTVETTLKDTRQLIADALTKPLSGGFGFVSLSGGQGGRLIKADEEDKRSVLWACGRTICCRPDDWIVI